ncbi:ROK family protein [Psittacicella gerlachiana]|uniref:N-acetylmannosamine kinase n=1 Tax=Psittacicella gerlachiana TaxID=2028574 RepID=A0A3A1YCY5_9GAMM|nr:ROK family protein [Psittacicella gerlachiana]RIY35089.1 hypothetical protein CKF59_04160 [Psittacicella gerlachiana]
MKVLAIDIGGTKVATAIIDNNLNIEKRLQFESRNDHTPTIFEEFFTDIISHYDAKEYDAIAIGTAGIVNKGIYTCLTKTSIGELDGLEFIDLFKRISGGKPVVALNDAQAATYAEYCTAQLSNMCFVTVSTGVGGGFILNDDILLGEDCRAGHIGHMLIKTSSPVAQIWGDYAKVEDMASGRAIAAATKDWDKPLTTAEVFEGQANGDQRCDAIVKAAAEAIAQMVANIVISYDIQDFFLGGSVSYYTNFIDQVQELVNSMPDQYHARLHRAAHGQDSVLVGSAQYYFNRGLKGINS